MPSSGAFTFGDIEGKLSVLRIVCEKCGRSGQYPVAKMIEKHGRDYMLTTFTDEVTADCPRMIRKDYSDWCGANSPDMVKVFMPNGVPSPEPKRPPRGWR